MFNAQKPSLGPDKTHLVYDAPNLSKFEQKEIEYAFTRCFSTPDGQKVLSYLQLVTFHRALGATAPDEQLRYMEGQRSLIATILRLIDRGRAG